MSPLSFLLALACQAQAEPVAAEVARVIDGDTLEVLLEGRIESLRLLSVDTEEKISGRPLSSPTKPETVFGQETALWARELFAGLGVPARVGLVFPDGRERDAYGRLLCHLILPDGRDFNLLLVELGKSPYFTKYGYSRHTHEAFLRAQEAAREAELGIWNPRTNRAQSPGAPSAVRPYAELLPWWEARAQAIEGFRRRHAAEPKRVLSAQEPDDLARALDLGQPVQVFAAIERFYDEPDGSLTVLLGGGGRERALRARVAPAARAELEPFLRATSEEFRQNYLFVEGRLERNERGYLLEASQRACWRVAEPVYPPGKR
jgi:micrococcal nuclease